MDAFGECFVVCYWCEDAMLMVRMVGDEMFVLVEILFGMML